MATQLCSCRIKIDITRTGGCRHSTWRNLQDICQLHAPRVSRNRDRGPPRRTVGRYLDAEIVIARQPQFGPPAIAGLEQHRPGIGGGRLVDLDLVARAFVVEQGRRRAQAQPVDRISRVSDVSTCGSDLRI